MMKSQWDLHRDRNGLIEECKASGLDVAAFVELYPEDDTNLVRKYTGIVILQLGAVMAPLIHAFCESSSSMSEGNFKEWMTLVERLRGFWGYYNVFWSPRKYRNLK